MTSPITSKYQASSAANSTFQPSISSSDSDYSDEQKGLADYQKVYGAQGSSQWGSGASSNISPSIPVLSMAYTSAPDLIPTIPNSTGGSGSSGAPALNFPVQIDLAALLSTETTFLDATKTTVDDYENLVPVVENAINSATFFGQQLTMSAGGSKNKKAQEIFGTGKPADSLDSEGKQFAATITPGLQKLMHQGANLAEAMGVFTALLNKVGQMYTETDAQSSYPPPGLMEGSTPPNAP